jgi:hypothetical protein
LNISYAADFSEAQRFAKEYEQEVKAREPKTQEEMEKSMWSVAIKTKIGMARYEENEQTVSSDYNAFYSEVSCAVVNQNQGDIEKAINLSYGQSITDKETWKISDLEYQTNDLDFYRLNFGASIGKVLYSDRYQNLRVVPFLGYGFRYINFERSDFVILSAITLRDVVNEEYYLHHADCGVKFDFPISTKWNVAGLGSFGYVFYNQADNSVLGKIDGGGGYIVNGNIDLRYAISDAWQLIFGGFVELQSLNGGQKGSIIWPDNDLNIYGGNIEARFVF